MYSRSATTLAVVVSPGVSPYLARTLRGLAEQTRHRSLDPLRQEVGGKRLDGGQFAAGLAGAAESAVELRQQSRAVDREQQPALALTDRQQAIGSERANGSGKVRSALALDGGHADFHGFAVTEPGEDGAELARQPFGQPP